MTRHDDTVSMQHMLDHAREIQQLFEEYNRETLMQNRLLNLAMTRLFEVLGEAANRVSTETRSTYPSIQWRDAIDLRNVLIHAYDTIDLYIV